MPTRTYIIPSNYLEQGYVFNGTIATRNALEGCVLGFMGYLLCRLLPFPSGIDAITYYLLVILPLFMIGVSGVQGDPVSVFLADVLYWRKHQHPYLYNENAEAFMADAADYLLDQPQFRDVLADKVAVLRQRFTENSMEYIEGETFRFAQDPEQEALRHAQAQLQKQAQAADPSAAVAQQPASPAPSKALDVPDLLGGIRLQDITQDNPSGGDEDGQ